MINREEWLLMRKTYLGGSDLGAVIGVNKYKTALDVYLEKTSEHSPEIGNDATYWGNVLEDVVAQEYSKRVNLPVEVETKLLRHPEHEFLAANIDRWVDGKKYVLECKTAGFMMSKEWGEEGSDSIPESYLVQSAWYAAICDVPKVDIAVLIGGQDFRIYSYVRNKEFEDKLIKIACNFWHNHVEKRIPPKCSSLADTFNLFPVGNHKELTANETIAQKIYELKTLRDQESSLQKAIDMLKVEIQEFMQDYDILLDSNGCVVATWKNTAPRSFFDTKRLKQECQDIYSKYIDYTKGSRMFLIK
jgi:putative phage-type endonuclease